MMDINQHSINSEYYTIYNISFSNFISFVFYIYLSLTEVYFICIWIPIHVIYYIDYSNPFILSSHYDSFYRYDMYSYICTYSHYVYIFVLQISTMNSVLYLWVVSKLF